MATPEQNFKRMNKIKNRGIDWDKDKDFVKTLRHAKGSDKYWEKLAAKKSGVVTSYFDPRHKNKKSGYAS